MHASLILFWQTIAVGFAIVILPSFGRVVRSHIAAQKSEDLVSFSDFPTYISRGASMEMARVLDLVQRKSGVGKPTKRAKWNDRVVAIRRFRAGGSEWS